MKPVTRRALSMVLACLMILSGCGSDRSEPASADALAKAVIYAGGYNAGNLACPADEAGMLELYVNTYYNLTEWEDCAVYFAGGVSAYEIAVIKLADSEQAKLAAEKLSWYIENREADFSGYSPDQAYIVHNGKAVRHGNYAALFICDDPVGAVSVFEAAFQDGLLYQEAKRPVTYPGRIEYIQPGYEDMSLYDMSAILSAWSARDSSGLNSYDLAIYNACLGIFRDRIIYSASGLELERQIYNLLTQECAYDWRHFDNVLEPPRESYTAYGPLVNGTGVCLGYAQAFELLCTMAGIECITIIGASYDSTRDHAWNMVRLGGNWYCVDVTWDIGDEAPEYFNVTSDYMAQTNHQWDYGSVPEAVMTDYGAGSEAIDDGLMAL